ncbi:hypothetical protein LTR29_001773 [Friedmanniomyces endolithicus]|nr:hypothetical protein LTR29_001773 [Friedmanniomyces endolithicus]
MPIDPNANPSISPNVPPTPLAMANRKPTTRTKRLQKHPTTRVPPTTPTNEPTIMALPPPAYHDGRFRLPIDDDDDAISLPSYHSSTLFPHYNPDDKHAPATTTTSRASMEVHADVPVDLEAQRAFPGTGVLVQQSEGRKPARMGVMLNRVGLIATPFVIGGFLWVVLATR